MNQRGAWSVRHCCRRLLPLGACAGLVAGAVLLGLVGCQSMTPRAQAPEEPEPGFDIKQVKTIRDVTGVANVAPIQVSGVGLVVGLDGTGGGTPPGMFTSMLEQQLLKQRVQGVKEILQSPNNAAVLISALIPAGAHKGDPIDIQVTLPQGSQVTSLRGGYLQQTVLRNYDSTRNLNPQAQSNNLLPGHVLAVARGPVVVGFGEGEEVAKIRKGVIWEGGVTLIDRPFYLVLNNDQRFARVANAVAERINLMFPDDARKRSAVEQNKRLWVLDEVTSQINDKFRQGPVNRSETAKAVTKDVVYAQIPLMYRLNPERYLRVTGFIPLRETFENQGKYRQQLEVVLEPESTIVAALRLEALGRDSIPALERGLKSNHVLVRFSTAEALAYLGNTQGIEELARLSDRYDALRAYGLTALATLNESICYIKLEELLRSPNAEMRYGAFKALRMLNEPYVKLEMLLQDPRPEIRQKVQEKLRYLDSHGGHTAVIKGELLNDGFWLHRVAAQSQALVHVSTGNRPEIVLFGEEARLGGALKLFIGSEFTLTAERGDDRCTLSRYVISPPSIRRKQCSFRLEDVLRTMADLGGQYSDVVDLLREVERAKCLSCDLAVDALPQAPPIEDLAQEGQLAKDGKPLQLLTETPGVFSVRRDMGSTPPIFSRNPNERTYGTGELQDEDALLRRGTEPSGN